jgi:hypothetical protein
MRLQIDQDFNAIECRSALTKLANHNLEPVELVLSNQRRFGGAFFREACVLEIVIYLLRTGRLESIRTHIKTTDKDLESSLQAFAKFPANLAALVHAGSVKFQNGDDIDAGIVSAAVAKLLEIQHDMQRIVDESKNGFAALVSSYASDDLLFPRALYSDQIQGDLVRDRFDELAHRVLFANVTGATKRVRDLASQLVAPIADLLFETYDNTDKHALTEASSKRDNRTTANDVRVHQIRGGVRGLFVRSIQAPKETITIEDAFIGGPKPLAATLKDWDLRFTGKTGHFFEVSVFDSGPGFAARLLGDEISNKSIETEFEAVTRCFGVGVTSSQSKGRGYGLVEVVRIVNERSGVFRVRTGRTCMYAPFHSWGVKEKSTIAERMFREPKEGLPHLPGAIVTAIIPAFGDEGA